MCFAAPRKSVKSTHSGNSPKTTLAQLAPSPMSRSTTGHGHLVSPRSQSIRRFLLGLAILAALLGLGVFEYLRTAPIRKGVGAFTQLIQAADQGNAVLAARFCAPGYLARHPLVKNEEGGLRGLPRSIHKNYTAWRQGPNIWICPTNRFGPVFQMVPDGPLWLFDGLAGELLPGREFVPAETENDQDSEVTRK